MNKNDKEHEKGKSVNIVVKIFFLFLCVLAAAQFALIAKCFTSLEALNRKFNTLEEGKTLGFKDPMSEGAEHETKRIKRAPQNTDIRKTLMKVEKLEKRLNESYQYLGSKHVFLLAGSPGKPGAPGRRGGRGIPGRRGPAGPPGDSAEVGVTYIRWGKKTCPNSGAALVYEGYVGGSYYKLRGGGSNYVCLTRHPIYETYQPGYQGDYSRIYGSEYQRIDAGIFPRSLGDHDVPCAVCRVTRRTSKMMIPGRNVCPAGWTREYKGYLMAEKHSHYRTMYTCVDAYPDYTPGSYADKNGALFYFVEGRCGSLPCGPYVEGRELTCAVCTR